MGVVLPKMGVALKKIRVRFARDLMIEPPIVKSCICHWY